LCWIYGEDITEIKKKGSSLTLWLLKFVCKNATSVIANSQSTEDKLHAIGVNTDLIKKAYPGVDTTRFKPFYNTNRFKRRYAPGGQKIILSVGRLIDRKGFDSVIRVFPKILEKFGSVKYIIAGNGPEKKSLELITKENDLNGSIIFLEGVTHEELPELYNACDIFVMPNRIGKDSGDVEGFGMVFLEASACGKPVIAGKSGGAVEAVKDRFTGFLVQPDDEMELENRISELISNKAYAARMGRNGYNRCHNQFTWEKTARDLDDIISSTY
jgi:phosphatidylinositol alpha-1,6-mannosyltransferase